MIGFDEYRSMDGTAIAKAISEKKLSSEEVLACAIERAIQVNPKINAIVQPFYDEAKNNQHHYEGAPFNGVPFLLKDLLNDIAGKTTGNGSATGCLSVANCNSTMVSRFEKLGLVTLGKTNTPEFGLMATTEPLAFGATRNPWDLSLSSGGSSGGSAAAVAAGIVPLASAGDGGGSIRIPAACCGLFGFKPSRGLNPLGPNAQVWSGAVSEHVVTRSVRDSVTVLRGTMGSDEVSHVAQKLPDDFLHKAYIPLQKPLRIGYSWDNVYGGSVSQQSKAAVNSAVKLLESLGHTVEECAPTIDGEVLLTCYADIYLAHINAQVSELVAQYGYKKIKPMLEPLTILIYQIGKRFSAGDYMRSQQRWAELAKGMHTFFQRYDVWLSPVLSVPTYALGDMLSTKLETFAMKVANSSRASNLLNSNILYKFTRPLIQKVPYTQIANLTGLPAMSVPLYWSDAGLPCGVQFTGRALDDELLFRLAAQLEVAQPWFNKVPTI